MKNRVKNWAIVACGLVFLASCGVESTDEIVADVDPMSPIGAGVELVLPVTQGSVNPLETMDKINLVLADLVWESLFTMDGQFQAVPVICSGYSVSDSGLEWTFWLAGEKVFSDGSPVTGDDVAFSLLEGKKAGSSYQERLSNVVKVESFGDGVKVTLGSPNGGLPNLLQVPIMSATTGLGSGAYVFEGESLVANKQWWNSVGQEPTVAEISLREIPSADDLIYAFDSGEISLVTADLTSPSGLSYGGNNYEIYDYVTTTMEYVGYNHVSGVCSDVLVRQALSSAFDRNTVAVALYARHAEVAELPVHPYSPLYQTDVAEQLSYNPIKTAELLEQAGYTKKDDEYYYKGNKQLSVKMVVNSDNNFRTSVADYLASELERIGVRVQVEKLQWADYEKSLQNRSFDLYLGGTVMTGDFDLTALISGGLNYGGYWSAEMTGALAGWKSSTGDERGEKAREMYQLFAQEVPFSPLVFKSESMLSQWGKLKEHTPKQGNLFYGVENWGFYP